MLILRHYLLRSSCLRIRLNSTIEPAKADSAAHSKETLLNRWVTFWKMLLKDYKIAFVEIAKSMKENPGRTLVWSCVGGFSTACCIMNPDETHYRNELIRKMNQLIYVAKSIRNPECVEYLQMIEWFYDCDEIRRINLGLFSLILHAHKSTNNALYRNNCSYLQPSFAEILDNILDIGFWNKWWMLEKMLVDYDVNPEEWK